LIYGYLTYLIISFVEFRADMLFEELKPVTDVCLNEVFVF